MHKCTSINGKEQKYITRTLVARKYFLFSDDPTTNIKLWYTFPNSLSQTHNPQRLNSESATISFFQYVKAE